MIISANNHFNTAVFRTRGGGFPTTGGGYRTRDAEFWTRDCPTRGAEHLQ